LPDFAIDRSSLRVPCSAAIRLEASARSRANAGGFHRLLGAAISAS